MKPLLEYTRAELDELWLKERTEDEDGCIITGEAIKSTELYKVCAENSLNVYCKHCKAICLTECYDQIRRALQRKRLTP